MIATSIGLAVMMAIACWVLFDELQGTRRELRYARLELDEWVKRFEVQTKDLEESTALLTEVGQRLRDARKTIEILMGLIDKAQGGGNAN